MRAFVLLSLALISSGCANTWDTLTSRKFRDKPFETMFVTEDPLTVMKNCTEGDERAHAMHRLKEPIRHGGTSNDQDDALQLLSAAACGDPSPVVRVAAIDALGRFEDGRVVAILTAAYQNGDGIPAGVEKPKRLSRTSDSDDILALADRYSLRGPVGFSDEVVSAIRSRAVTALAGTGKPEAMAVLAQAAKGGESMPIDRDTQLAAVRGLAKMRTAESVPILVGVMKAEKGKDPALTARAHESLVSLTGKDYPAEPEKWEVALKSGTATIVPEPSSSILQVGAWLK
jgi:hypothetical protein